MFSSSTSPINTREPTFTMNWQCKITHYNDSHKIFLRTFTIANRLSATIPTWVRRIWFRTKYWLRGGWIWSWHLHFIKQIVSHRKNTKNKLHFQEIWKKCLMPRSDILQIPPHVYWRRSECRHPIFGYTIPAIGARSGLSPIRLCPCRAYQKWDAPSQVHPTANLNNQ